MIFFAFCDLICFLCDLILFLYDLICFYMLLIAFHALLFAFYVFLLAFYVVIFDISVLASFNADFRLNLLTYDITDILLKVALNTINQIKINEKLTDI